MENICVCRHGSERSGKLHLLVSGKDSTNPKVRTKLHQKQRYERSIMVESDKDRICVISPCFFPSSFRSVSRGRFEFWGVLVRFHNNSSTTRCKETMDTVALRTSSIGSYNFMHIGGRCSYDGCCLLLVIQIRFGMPTPFLQERVPPVPVRRPLARPYPC